MKPAYQMVATEYTTAGRGRQRARLQGGPAWIRGGFPGEGLRSKRHGEIIEHSLDRGRDRILEAQIVPAHDHADRVGRRLGHHKRPRIALLREIPAVRLDLVP